MEPSHLLAEVSDEDVIPPHEKKPKIDEFADENCEKSRFGPAVGRDYMYPYGVSDDDDYGDDFFSNHPEEYKQYCKEVEESEGYDVQTLVGFFGCIHPMDPIPSRKVERFNRYCQHAIDKYNSDNGITGASFQFLKVVRVNVRVDCTACLYITFLAKHGVDVAAETKTFQTQIYPKPRGEVIEEVRLKP